MSRGKPQAGWQYKGWAAALGCLLVLAIATPAFALGLGQIQVRSQAGQPLLAEIPIITSDPSELDNLQARLASPDTFRRIGLQPPQGIVSDLQFAVALDARGNPVIRVTSPVPVQQSLLTFLVEVDWGQGRLVREYSALLDAPQTVSAPAQPAIQAPMAPPSNTVIRAPMPVAPVATVEPRPEPQPEPAPATPSRATAPEPESEPAARDAIAVAPTPEVPVPVPARPVPAAPAPAMAATGLAEYGPVRAGETLGRIAAGLAPEGYTREQTMLALLRANPDAFINDNVNLVRQGAVLRMPETAQLSQYSAAEARAVVRAQISQWREMRRPVPQPEAVAGERTVGGDNGAGTAGAAPRVADARLEITPPSQGSGQRAGTRSGIEAGGEGEMLRQEMQQTQETLAARNAEVEELKARVADLEQLQQQQQQLISLKDSELAAAQQRLAESNQRPATTLAQSDAGDPGSPAASAAGGGLPWLWIGLALLAAGVVAWLFTRRRRDPAPGRTFDTSALAAGMPRAPEEMREDAVPPVHKELREDVPEEMVAEERDDGMPQARHEGAHESADARAATASWITPPAGSVEMATPTWHSGTRTAPVEDASTVVSLNPSPAGQEHIEIARAYIDLGDVDTARSLLQEVADGGDAGAREEAARMLRGLA